MSKIPFNEIVMHQVGTDDPALDFFIPQLAYQQARAHDVIFEPSVITDSKENFLDIVDRNGVDIWMISQPNYAAGACFTSALKANGRYGLQGEDVVVNLAYRGKGFGAALISFRARLAKENGFDFVAWECEDGNDPIIHQRHEVFKAMGGTKRPGLKPFRLDKTVIDNMKPSEGVLESINTMRPYHQMPVIDYSWQDGSATVSQRFSIFRTLGRGNVDNGYNQTSTGIQIENLEFGNMDIAQKALSEITSHVKGLGNGCVFADIVVDENKPDQMELVKRFDAEQNTYSGNPSFLWILEGEAFEKAAARGMELKIG